MARDLYSVRLFSTASLTSSSGTVGPVVPVGFVYVMREMDLVELTGGSGVYMDIISPSLGPLVRVSRADTTTFGAFQWTGRSVYEEGEQLGVLVHSGTWSVTISGYQLTKP
jgi:hypothetical protein